MLEPLRDGNGDQDQFGGGSEVSEETVSWYARWTVPLPDLSSTGDEQGGEPRDAE